MSGACCNNMRHFRRTQISCIYNTDRTQQVGGIWLISFCVRHDRWTISTNIHRHFDAAMRGEYDTLSRSLEEYQPEALLPDCISITAQWLRRPHFNDARKAIAGRGYQPMDRFGLHNYFREFRADSPSLAP